MIQSSQVNCTSGVLQRVLPPEVQYPLNRSG